MLMAAESNSSSYTDLVSAYGGVTVFIRSATLCKCWFFHAYLDLPYFVSDLQGWLRQWTLLAARRMHLRRPLHRRVLRHVQRGLEWR